MTIISEFEVIGKSKCTVVLNKIEGTRFTIVENEDKSTLVIFDYGFNELEVKKYTNPVTFSKACPNLSALLEA